MQTLKKIFAALGFKGTFIVFVLILIVTIALQNMEPTRFDVLFWEFAEQPRLYFFLGSLGLGFLLGLFVGLWIRFGKKTDIPLGPEPQHRA